METAESRSKFCLKNQIFNGSNLMCATPDSTQFFYENHMNLAPGESRLGMTTLSNDHTVKITDESLGSSSMNDLTRHHRLLKNSKKIS